MYNQNNPSMPFTVFTQLFEETTVYHTLIYSPFNCTEITKNPIYSSGFKNSLNTKHTKHTSRLPLDN